MQRQNLNFARLLKISRPRFWIYVFGPYIVGLLIGANNLLSLQQPIVLLFGLFFTLPANLLIYGINDIFDYETDRRNRKKTSYEALVTPAEQKKLAAIILLLCVPFGVLLTLISSYSIYAMGAFLFFSLFYSAPPIRAKTRPILDSIFNVLYIIPGIFAYYLVGGSNVAFQTVAAAWMWAMAMHAYSAVPDISADRESGTPTIATLFGFHNTLVICLLLYAASAALAFPFVAWLAAVLGSIYVALMCFSLTRHGEVELLGVYKWFPLINTLCGMALFFYILFLKFL